MSHIQCIFDLDDDVMGLVLHQLARCKYGKVMEEFQLPLLRKAYKRLLSYDRKKYMYTLSVHPGRYLLQIIHPKYNVCDEIEDQSVINLCGLEYESHDRSYTHTAPNFEIRLLNDLSVADITALLKENKIKGYSKLKKDEKLRLLVRYYMSLD